MPFHDASRFSRWRELPRSRAVVMARASAWLFMTRVVTRLWVDVSLLVRVTATSMLWVVVSSSDTCFVLLALQKHWRQ